MDFGADTVARCRDAIQNQGNESGQSDVYGHIIDDYYNAISLSQLDAPVVQPTHTVHLRDTTQFHVQPSLPQNSKRGGRMPNSGRRPRQQGFFLNPDQSSPHDNIPPEHIHPSPTRQEAPPLHENLFSDYRHQHSNSESLESYSSERMTPDHTSGSSFIDPSTTDNYDAGPSQSSRKGRGYRKKTTAPVKKRGDNAPFISP